MNSSNGLFGDASHYESSYFLTFTYLPPAEDAARAETWLYEGKAERGVDGCWPAFETP